MEREETAVPQPNFADKTIWTGDNLDILRGLFEVDHVIPQSRGATDHIDNLQLLCSSCNRIKGNRPRNT